MSATRGRGPADARRRPVPLRARRRRGVTLIEMLVAMVLLSIGFLAIAPLFMTGIKANASSFDYTVANNLAREELERLQMIPSSDASLLVSSGTIATYPATDPCVTGGVGHNDLPCNFQFTDKATSGTIPNPYKRSYTVEKYTTITGTGTPPLVTFPGPLATGLEYDLKVIRVTVSSSRANVLSSARVTNTMMIKNTGNTGNRAD